MLAREDTRGLYIYIPSFGRLRTRVIVQGIPSRLCVPETVRCNPGPDDNFASITVTGKYPDYLLVPQGGPPTKISTRIEIRPGKFFEITHSVDQPVSRARISRLPTNEHHYILISISC